MAVQIYPIGNNIVLQEGGAILNMIAFRDLHIEPKEPRIFIKDLSENRTINYDFSEIEDETASPIGDFDTTLAYLAGFVGFNPAAPTASTLAMDTSDDMEILHNKMGVMDGTPALTYDYNNRHLNISTDAFNQYYRIKLGLDVGFNTVGTGLIEKIGASTFYGGVAAGQRTGFLIPGNTAGSGAGKILLFSDLGLNLDLGSTLSSERIGAIYSFNIDTATSLSSVRHIVGGPNSDQSAIFLVNSTTQGVLLPRMTESQRNAIPKPAESLLIYNKDADSYQFNNTPLQTSGTLTIGKVYHIYDYNSGDDFTNVGATSNVTGEIFTATGTTPATWTNGSSLGIPDENWNPLGGSSPLAVTQTVASISDNRIVKTDGAGRVIQETGVTLTDGNQIIGDNIFEEIEQTVSFTLTGSMASKHIDLNSATDAILTFPQQSTEALDSGYYVSVTNKNIGVWTIAVQGTDTLDGVNILKQNETALIKLDASGTPQNITVIGGHITILDNLMRFVDTVADQDYTVLLEALQPGKINSIITQSDSGTCTLTAKINGVALGGTANSVSNLTTTQTHTTSNTFVIGDKLLFTISANVSCIGMSVQFNIEYD